jgi:hypothetical protein
VLRYAEKLPALQETLAPMSGYMESMAADLAAGWHIEPPAAGPFRAAIAHALEFWTWRSLATQGLDTKEAAHLMVRFISAVADIKRTPQQVGGKKLGSDTAIV